MKGHQPKPGPRPKPPHTGSAVFSPDKPKPHPMLGSYKLVSMSFGKDEVEWGVPNFALEVVTDAGLRIRISDFTVMDITSVGIHDKRPCEVKLQAKAVTLGR